MLIKSIKTTSTRYRTTSLMNSCRQFAPTHIFPPPLLIPPTATPNFVVCILFHTPPSLLVRHFFLPSCTVSTPPLSPSLLIPPLVVSQLTQSFFFVSLFNFLLSVWLNVWKTRALQQGLLLQPRCLFWTSLTSWREGAVLKVPPL